MNAPYAPPTSRDLLLALEDYLRESLAGYPFPTASGDSVDARVFIYGLPEGQEEQTFPFVILRWTGGEVETQVDQPTLLTDTVTLILGVCSPTSQEEAGILLAELLDVTRRAVWMRRVLAGRFTLAEPLKASLPDIERKQHKFHLATIETTWTYCWPSRGLYELTKMEEKNG